MQELRPPALEERGLAVALEAYAQQWAERNNIDLRFAVRGERSLLLPVEQSLYRVAQEALANIARHSDADTVDLRLDYTADTVTLRISDNGQGFDVSQPPAGFGLQSMRERIEALPGGIFEVTSAPQQGTIIIARCNL